MWSNRNVSVIVPTKVPIRPCLDLQAALSTRKNEECVTGRGACVFLCIQRKGCSEPVALGTLGGARLCGGAPGPSLCWAGLPILSFWECYVNGHTIHNLGGISLFSLSIIFWILIQVIWYISSLLFLLVSNIPWYRYTVVCLVIHRVKDVWAVSSFLWLKLLWTSVYRFLYEHNFLFFWDKYPGVQLPSHMVVACLAL